MADYKDYLIQKEENGNILISEEVLASISAIAVREVEGVYGLSTTATFDLGNILGKKNLRKGIRVTFSEKGFEVSCNLIVKMGCAVMEVAKNVQEAILAEIFAMTGAKPARINVNVCGIAFPKAD